MPAYFSLLFACSFFCLSIAPAFAMQMTTEQTLTSDLNHRIPQEEQRELTVDGQPFLLLRRDRMTSFNKGTAILVPDWAEHAASPKHIDNLRQKLADFGWNTFALMPPATEFSQADAQTLEQYGSALKARMQATLQLAQQNSGVVIVIAQGASAATLNALYAAEQLPEPAALIILGAYLPEPALNREFANALASHQVPTLDISHPQDNRHVTQQLKLRRQLVEKQLKAVYRQRLIVGSGYNSEIQQWVFQEIYGWLISVGL
ncbi:DUF3530 family protein [Rheinheimera maricola]|uniref:Alpha/beta hydrolase family protein n=1 Tax=Rheinheimera maricola TaxID=2793282 RepID=A0ABS7XCB1_9GAMM|nr:DUF3530 family protein [Rheinheimera maricola]MBZ9612257.1 alpha/beta hydrolase family protein [Rheinheimera maricola]